MIQKSFSSSLMSGQVKVGMIGHIHNCVLICGSLIMDLDLIILCQGISNLNSKVSRESLVHIRAVQSESHCVFLLIHFLYFPYPGTVPVRTTVEIIFIIIHSQLIFFSV